MIIATALAWPSKEVPTSGYEFSNHMQGLFDDVEAYRAASTKAKKKIKRHKRLVSIAKKSANSTLNYDAGLYGRVAVGGTLDAELLPSASAGSSQIVRTTAEVRQVRDTSMTQSKKLP